MNEILYEKSIISTTPKTHLVATYSLVTLNLLFFSLNQKLLSVFKKPNTMLITVDA